MLILQRALQQEVLWWGLDSRGNVVGVQEQPTNRARLTGLAQEP